MKPVFSIIIPHYNSPTKLGRLLDSIPQKDEIQVIVVDDISTKDVELYEQIKKKYEAKALFLDNTMDNKGAGGARNVGLEKACGKWLLFADSDDFFLDTMWDALDRHRDDEEDIIFFPPISRMEGREAASDRFMEFSKFATDYLHSKKYGRRMDKPEWNLRLKWVAPWSKLIKKSLVDRYDIRFETTRYSNDYYFGVVSGVRAESIKASYEVIYCITESQGTLTTSGDAKEQEIREDVYRRCQAFKNKEVSFYHRLITDNLYWDRMLVESIENGCLKPLGGLYKVYKRIRYGAVK